MAETKRASDSAMDRLADNRLSVEDRTTSSTEHHHTDSQPKPRDPDSRKSLDGMDYSYLEGMPAPWPVSSADGIQYSGVQSPDAQTGLLANGNWEDFMRWNPNQAATNGHENGQNGIQDAHSDVQKSALYNRRAGSVLTDPSLGLTSAGSAQSSIPTSHSLPYTFGQVTTGSPAFAFSADALISPAVSQAHHMSFPNSSAWSSQSPLDPNGSAMVSPLSFDGQRPFGSVPTHTLSVSSHQQSPDSGLAQTSPSATDASSPETGSANGNAKKRKSQSADNEGNDSDKPMPIKKTAHNMIEKRYRTNLNDKIAALRDSVPSLRVMSRPGSHGDEDDDNEDLGGLTPAHKLNKATVLSKATEYIRHLEKRNRKLQDELNAVKSRLDSLEKMSMGPVMAVHTPDSMSRYQEDPFARATPAITSVSQGPAQGMIPVPENIMALRQQASMANQAHYAPNNGYQGYNPVNARQGMAGAGQQPMVNGRPSNLMNKLMVGSLAGLMLFEGFSEHEKSGETPAGRGLFAVPFSLIGEFLNMLIPRTIMFGMSPYAALSVFKLFLIVAAFGYLITPLLDFKPRPKKKVATIPLVPAPSLASPVEVRRKAWLTAIQTVWIPRHNFLLEVAALLLKTVKLSTRKLVGWQGYAFVTGITKEQELARVKAWKIALDAQLTGGDAEISMSRLVLTLMASGTLPDTPARLMLKALHIRILLWEVAKAGYGTWYMFDELSSKLARSYWNAARHEHKLASSNGVHPQDTEEVEPLPDHLAALLELESDEVLVPVVIQRAYNLAWNRPSTENVKPDESMDSVVEDFAISSPLDALAAWWSSLKLGHVLASSFTVQKYSTLEANLDMVVRTAPPTSSAQIRAFVARAVLIKKDRMEHVLTAYKALPSDVQSPRHSSPNALLNAISQTPVSPDVHVALSLAKCLALTEIPIDDPMSAVAHQRAAKFVNMYRPTEKRFSVLSFVASLSVLELFCSDKALLQETRSTLESLANSLRIWIGHDTAIPPKIRSRCVGRCVSANKMLVGVVDIDAGEESDAGYHSQEEDVNAHRQKITSPLS